MFPFLGFVERMILNESSKSVPGMFLKPLDVPRTKLLPDEDIFGGSRVISITTLLLSEFILDVNCVILVMCLENKNCGISRQ